MSADESEESFAFFENSAGKIYVIKIDSDGVIVKLLYNENYEKLNPGTEIYKKLFHQILNQGSEMRLEVFGSSQDNNINLETMKYPDKIDLKSKGYIIKGRTHPRDIRLENFNIMGSGVHGVIVHKYAPDCVDIDLKNFFYVRGPVVKKFFKRLAELTYRYLDSYISYEGKHKNDKQLKLLTKGWNLFLMSDFISTEKESKYNPISFSYMREIFDWWYSNYIEPTGKKFKNKFANLKIPTPLIPSIINVIMVNRGYKSLVFFDGAAIIYPPYVRGTKIEWNAKN